MVLHDSQASAATPSDRAREKLGDKAIDKVIDRAVDKAGVGTGGEQELKTTMCQQARPRIMEGRIHYLDNLRALAMILGVVLHAGLAYATPAQEVWLATDSQGSVVIDMSIWLIPLFAWGCSFCCQDTLVRCW